MSSGPKSMITLPISYPWHVCTPTIFRYLNAEHVDAFFSDGSLRLSSFARFKTHADEQRMDAKEGEVHFVHRTNQNGGQTLYAKSFHGTKAFVLCATMRHDNALMADFGCDSYIRIENPTEFGARVARHIPGLQAGAEGPCLYQNKKFIERDLGYLDTKLFADPADPSKPNVEAISRILNDQMRHWPLFLKERSFASQAEYRLLWLTSADIDGYVDIKVPEAIPLCSRPSELTQ